MLTSLRPLKPSIAVASAIDWARLRQNLAMFLLLAFAGGTFYGVGLANGALAALLLLALIDVWRRGYPLHRDPLACLAAVIIVYLVLQALLWPLLAGHDAQAAQDGFKDWLKVSYLFALPVAYWVGRRPQIVVWLLVALCIGYFARVFERLDWQLLQQLAEGRTRATFGNSANNFGTWSAIVVVALLALAYHQTVSSASRWVRAPCLVFLAACVLAALAGLVFSQARGAWVAALVAGLGVALLLLRAAFGAWSGRQRLAVLGLLAVLGGGSGLLVVNYDDIVQQRLSQEQDVIADIVGGHWQDVRRSSVGMRVHMTEAALEHWRERPLTGRGLGSAEALLADEEGRRHLGHFTHYHNSYLMILVELGAVGFLLLAAGVVLCVRQARRGVRRDIMPAGSSLFLLGGALALGVAALVSEPLSSYRGAFLIALLAGIAYSSAFACANEEHP